MQKHTILSALDPQQLGHLAAHAKELQLPAGDVLFLQGDTANHFYVVRHGEVQILVPAINGPALDVQTLGKGDVIG